MDATSSNPFASLLQQAAAASVSVGGEDEVKNDQNAIELNRHLEKIFQINLENSINSSFVFMGDDDDTSNRLLTKDNIDEV